MKVIQPMPRLTFYALMFIAFILNASVLHAQQRSMVKGVVRNNNGDLIEGVSVILGIREPILQQLKVQTAQAQMLFDALKRGSPTNIPECLHRRD